MLAEAKRTPHAPWQAGRTSRRPLRAALQGPSTRTRAEAKRTPHAASRERRTSKGHMRAVPYNAHRKKQPAMNAGCMWLKMSPYKNRHGSCGQTPHPCHVHTLTLQAAPHHQKTARHLTTLQPHGSSGQSRANPWTPEARRALRDCADTNAEAGPRRAYLRLRC